MTFIKTYKDEDGNEVKDPNINREGHNKGCGSIQMLDALMEKQEGFDKSDIAKGLYEIAMNAGTKERIAALKILADFTHTKPAQKVDQTIDDKRINLDL